MQGAVGDRLTGFELMSRVCLDHVITHFPATVEPFSARYDWQVLVELADTYKDAALEDALSSALEPAFESGQALDAIIATSEAQSQALWNIREQIPAAEKLRGRSVKHDISVPISCIAEFIQRGDVALDARFPDAQVICFGHIGDGNLHYNLSFPGVLPSPEQTRDANDIVYALLDELGGSISAEHGLGQMKRDEIIHHKSVVALDMMRAIKNALDPAGIMNPGKVL
jgi:FAD/FMN-containing dehydrogenase